ncbi:hypothetical protein E2C01_052697 [Portunus trituberculatus]|uniref:Uncharacterized protein n=1 Tax=Portunus trituberculatus TaxID=210409 RepID=A0A5B7GEE6_PORTR|nr:hypothetical protein [Portunus trituberculatus]
MYNDSVSALFTRTLHNSAHEAFTHQGGIKGGFRAHRDVGLVLSLLVERLQGAEAVGVFVWSLEQERRQFCENAGR